MFGSSKVATGVGSGKTIINVTDGSGGSSYGFSNHDGNVWGSIDQQPLNAEINALRYWDTTLDQFQFYVKGNHAKESLFITVQAEGGDLETAAASFHSYDAGTDTTQWFWLSSKPAGWDGSGTSTVTIIV